LAGALSPGCADAVSAGALLFDAGAAVVVAAFFLDARRADLLCAAAAQTAAPVKVSAAARANPKNLIFVLLTRT
jgi:hypothetical protein